MTEAWGKNYQFYRLTDTGGIDNMLLECLSVIGFSSFARFILWKAYVK